MAVSIGEALNRAIARTQAVCFQPFRAGKWFVIGFAAWLATLFEGGFSFNFNYGGRTHLPSSGKVLGWIHAHLDLLIVLGIAAFVLWVAFMVLLTWLRARGRFMLLDNIARNPEGGLIVEPWKRFASVANRLMWFQLVLWVGGALVMGLIIGGGLLIAWPDIHARTFGWPAGIALLVGVPVYLVLALTMMVVHGFTLALVMPLMYQRGCGPVEGWRILWREMRPGNAGPLVLFALLKVGLFVTEGVIITLGTCVTCCIAAIPYVRAVVFLPLHVFNLALDAYFIEQFGPGFRVLPELAAAPTPFPVLPGPGTPPPPPLPSEGGPAESEPKSGGG